MKMCNAAEALTYVDQCSYQISQTASGKSRIITHFDMQSNLSRTGRFLDVSPSGLVWFLTHSVNWLPTDSNALLWVDYLEISYPSVVPVLWKLLECHPHDSPFGIYFQKFGYDILDSFEAHKSDSSKNLEDLISLLILVVVSESPARLIACAGPEFIEFWEGNIFFHSTDPTRLAKADNLFAQYGVTSNPT